MAFISASHHRSFLEALGNSIQDFEAFDCPQFASQEIAAELKDKKMLLDGIYSEYSKKIKQLIRLIDQYNQIQRHARIRLRSCQHRYSKLQAMYSIKNKKVTL